jgi:flagellar motor switch protein FliG
MEQLVYDKLVFTNDFKVRYVDVLVLLDEKIFKDKDVAFVKSVITMRSGSDDIRGDTLSVRPITFPTVLTTARQEEAKAKADAEAAKAQQLPPPAPPKPEGLFTSSNGLIIGLLLLIVLLLLINIFKKPEHKAVTAAGGEKRPALPDQSDSARAVTDKIGSLALMPSSDKDKKDMVVASSPKQSQEDQQKEEMKGLYYELRQLMVTTLVGNPGFSSEVFKQWVEADKDEGIYKTAAFFKATDSNLTELVAEYLGTELRAKIEFAMSQMVSFDQEGVVETFKKFREDFQKLQYLKSIQASSGGMNDQKDFFQFLKQLDSNQIFHVIKDEEIGIMAIVLAQMPPEVANAVIQELPEDKKNKIPVEMGKLKKVPLAVYRDVANRLAKKAVEAQQIKYIMTDGVEALLKMLEEAPPEQEKQLINNIREQDIALANALKKFYLPFEELTILPDKFLSDIVRSFDREVIIKALIGASQEVQDKVINNLGPRVRIIVSDALKTAEDIPLDEVYHSRHEITRKISDMARTGKIDLIKLYS